MNSPCGSYDNLWDLNKDTPFIWYFLVIFKSIKKCCNAESIGPEKSFLGTLVFLYFSFVGNKSFARRFHQVWYQDIVKATGFAVLEDLTFKISEGLD